jgi:hypothetical protein
MLQFNIYRSGGNIIFDNPDHQSTISTSMEQSHVPTNQKRIKEKGEHLTFNFQSQLFQCPVAVFRP